MKCLSKRLRNEEEKAKKQAAEEQRKKQKAEEKAKKQKEKEDLLGVKLERRNMKLTKREDMEKRIMKMLKKKKS